LDGTIIDAGNRLYALFAELAPDSRLSFDEYWNLKRNKIDHKAILFDRCSNADFQAFEQKWLSEIESPRMLAHDRLYDGALQLLENLSKCNEIFAITARQSRKLLSEELKKLGIYGFFKDILITEHKCSKEALLKRLAPFSHDDFMVGDTGQDILAGKAFGLKTVAVVYGFLSKAILLKYAPDFLVDDLPDLGGIFK